MPHITPLISIIMPVYNSADFLPFTLRNITGQQFPDNMSDVWELIIVDDGSTDSSISVINEWMARYPSNIRLLRQDNAGPSVARNRGLDAARGEYVYFCDSDDIILQGGLAELCEKCIPQNADIIKFMHRVISPKDYLEDCRSAPRASVASQGVRLLGVEEYLQLSKALLGPPEHYNTWQSVYRRQLLTSANLKFDTNLRVGEDVCFLWSALLQAKTICYTDAILFEYHLRKGSITHNNSRKKHELFLVERVKFAGRLITIKHQAERCITKSADILPAIDTLSTLTYYHSLLDLIVDKYPMSTIYRCMRLYRDAGGNVHPGRPRFTPFYDSGQQSTAIKLRRMFVAYILCLPVWLKPRKL